MSRFFTPKENIKGNTVYISGQEARHILNVMRLSNNDKVVVFDGTGKEYIGFIKDTKPKSLTVEVVETRTPSRTDAPSITLVQAIPKKDKMDYIVEKATELGVSAVIPVVSKRTVVRVDTDLRLKRWQRISQEASKQCGRLDIPRISPIMRFNDAVDEINNYDFCLMACLWDKTASLHSAISSYTSGSVIVFVGPEGDFTPDEIQRTMNNSNCKLVSLGRKVLKSDTAALYIISCLNYELSK